MRVSVWVAVVCPDSGRVLLAKRAPTTRNANRWNFFGGGVDPGEHPEETALRELREEAGVEAAPSELVFLGQATTRVKRNLLYVITAEAEFAPTLNHESQEWRWVPLGELLAHQSLHAPTRQLSPMLHQWAEHLPDMPAAARGHAWAWLRRQLAGHWPR